MLETFLTDYVVLVLIPILVGLLQVVKAADKIDVKYIPILSVVGGLVIGFFFGELDTKGNIILGLVIGLSAVGLFSSTKNVVEKLDRG